MYRHSDVRERHRRAIDALRQVSLGHRLNASPTTMSGGERQRVAIARALVSQPNILLADEPTGNLDTNTSKQILDVFDQLHASGITVAVITHDFDLADRAARTIDVCDGTVSERYAA